MATFKRRTLIVLLMLSLALFVVIIPLQQTFAHASDQSYENFSSSLQDMLEYDNNQGVMAMYLTDEQPEDCLPNRLIVTSNKSVQNFGAVKSAEYDEWHIFQYDCKDDTLEAYKNFCDLGFEVTYDFQTYVDDVESEAVNEDWGWDYIGVDEYTRTMLTMHQQSELSNIVVAVLDSGINTSHELFTDRILLDQGKNFSGEEINYRYDFEDLYSHGTHVSGTIAQKTLSNVKILPLKVLNSTGRGNVSMIINAIEYIISLKNAGLNIKIANMSIGVDASSVGGGVSARNTALNNAVEKLYRNNIIPVVSAGNEKIDTTFASPANVENAITVSALRQTSNYPLGQTVVFDSSYSNYGEFVDFSAPGTSIYSAGVDGRSSYTRKSGTSMAAPHVTACVALVYSNPFYQNYSPDQVYDLLRENAVDYGTKGWDELYGWGCINIENIGVLTSGYVNFDIQESFSQTGEVESRTITLSYEDDAIIHYSLQSNSESYENILYSGPITLTETTKITAYAELKDKSNGILKQSFQTSNVYYFHELDLLTNYEFMRYYNGYVVTRYVGTDLTTLQVPKYYKNDEILGIGELAFSNANVKVLRLPESVRIFDQSAFSGNTKIEEIYCDGKNVQIGDYAFSRCSNLSVFDVPNVIYIGAYGFAYDTALEKLELLRINEIGRHALSGSGIKELYIGNSDQLTIDEQSSLSLECVYGYVGQNDQMSPSEKLAYDQNVDFVDMTLRVTKDLGQNVIVRNGDELDLGIQYVGYQTTYRVFFDNSQYSAGNVSAQDDEGTIETNLDIHVFNLTTSRPSHTLRVEIKDALGTIQESQTLQIEVIGNDDQVFNINYNGEHTELFVDDSQVESSSILYKYQNYELVILPENGYELQSILIDGVSRAIYDKERFVYTLSNQTEDVDIVAVATAKEELDLTFDLGGLGSVLTEEGDQIESAKVLRENNSFKFKIVPNTGYSIRRVLAGRTRLDADENGFYTITDITTDVNITVVFEAKAFHVNLSLGKGGNIFTSGSLEGDLAYGATKEFEISANDGYEVDFVTINGKEVEVVDGKFVLENITEDANIVVSFKKNTGGVFANNSVVVIYFLIFLSLLFVFALAKVILAIVRKKEAERKKKLHSH